MFSDSGCRPSADTLSECERIMQLYCDSLLVCCCWTHPLFVSVFMSVTSWLPTAAPSCITSSGVNTWRQRAALLSALSAATLQCSVQRLTQRLYPADPICKQETSSQSARQTQSCSSRFTPNFIFSCFYSKTSRQLLLFMIMNRDD